MFSDIKNKLIVFLIKHTELYCSTMYEIVWQAPASELNYYIKEVAEAKEESGCYTRKEYSKWWKENYYKQLKERLKR